MRGTDYEDDDRSDEDYNKPKRNVPGKFESKYD